MDSSVDLGPSEKVNTSRLCLERNRSWSLNIKTGSERIIQWFKAIFSPSKERKTLKFNMAF